MSLIQAFEEVEDIQFFIDKTPDEFHAELQRTVICQILGNESDPDKMEFFSVNHYKCKPFLTFQPNNETGEMEKI